MFKEQKLKNGNVQLTGVTPKGTLKWVRVNKPDEKYGTYSLTLLMNKDPETDKFFAVLDEQMDKAEEMARAKGARRMPARNDMNYGEEFDNSGNPTGKLFIRAKARASGITNDGKEWHFKPAVFDVYGKPYTDKNMPMIGNGSIGRVAVSVFPYAQPIGYGVSIRLNALQVIDLVEYSANTAESYGFTAEQPADPLNTQDTQPQSYRDSLSEEQTGDF